MVRAIANSQMRELGEMQGWLRLWNQAFLPATPEMNWMLLGNKPLDERLNQYLIVCRQSPAGMPGIASNDDIAQLRCLAGRERDKLFLRLMLAHHQGSIPMAEYTATQAKLPAVRKIAAQIVLDQSKEIDHIQAILAAISITAID